MKNQIEMLKAIHSQIEMHEENIERLKDFYQQWDAICSRGKMISIMDDIKNSEKKIKQLRAKAGQVCYDLIKEL